MFKQALIVGVLLSVIQASLLAHSARTQARSLSQMMLTGYNPSVVNQPNANLIGAQTSLTGLNGLKDASEVGKVFQVKRDYTSISDKTKNSAGSLWGITIQADHDLSLDETRPALRHLVADVAEFFGSAYIEDARFAAKIFLDKPDELKSVTVWYHPEGTTTLGTSPLQHIQFLFEVSGKSFSMNLEGGVSDNQYSYDISFDKVKDSEQISVKGAKINSWIKLITDIDMGINDQHAVVKELASTKEVATRLNMGGSSGYYGNHQETMKGSKKRRVR